MRAATTLCAAHYLACSASIYATQTLGYVKKVSLPVQGERLAGCRHAMWCSRIGTRQRHMYEPLHAGTTVPMWLQHVLDSASCMLTCGVLPRTDLILFTATANTSIVTLNLSLLLNKVGFYQVGACTWLYVRIQAVVLHVSRMPCMQSCAPCACKRTIFAVHPAALSLLRASADSKAAHHTIRVPGRTLLAGQNILGARHPVSGHRRLRRRHCVSLVSYRFLLLRQLEQVVVHVTWWVIAIVLYTGVV